MARIRQAGAAVEEGLALSAVEMRLDLKLVIPLIRRKQAALIEAENNDDRMFIIDNNFAYHAL